MLLSLLPGTKVLKLIPIFNNGFSYHYHLGESTSIFRGVRSDFYFLLIFR